MKQGMFGVVLFLIGLWGGSWAFYEYGTSWAEFPLSMTAFGLCFSGVFVAVHGFLKGEI